MSYKSTRGGVVGATFEETLFSGYAPDGGLFIPEEIPQLTQKVLTEWRTLRLTYPEIVNKIVRMYITPEEISNDELHNCVRRAYGTFKKDEVIGIKAVKDKAGNSVKIAELFHGRTGSFKDLAMSLVGQLIEHFMKKKEQHVTILVSTSGDTGSAAIDAVRGSKNIDIIVLYPKGKISQVQEWQMRSTLDKNVHLYEVEGTSDDSDVPIRKSLPAPGITSINSINWARIMIQIAHYVYLYLLEGDEVEVIVPTGAAGNVASGLYAQRMGVPLKLHVATNQNDCVDLILSKGIFKMNEDVKETPACAMDIGSPYNVERLLYLVSDTQTILELVDKEKAVQIPTEILTKLKTVIKGSLSVDSQIIYDTMKACYSVNKYLICPHTATAMHYFTQKLSGTPRVYILATASPSKFADSVAKAGLPLSAWIAKNPFYGLESLPMVEPKLMTKGQDWFKILQDKIKEIRANRQ